jgi:hypothetical protein
LSVPSRGIAILILPGDLSGFKSVEVTGVGRS